MVKIEKIVDHLNEFYSLADKKIIHVGVGKGTFLDYTRHAASILAIDNKAANEKTLNDKIYNECLSKKCTVKIMDFMECDEKSDVVFLEFCLHEMKDQTAILKHAKSLANDVVIIDHAPKSEWTWYTDEAEKVNVSWNQIAKFGAMKTQDCEGFQIFSSYSDLKHKIGSSDDIAIDRIKEFEGDKQIRISMPYRMCLL